MHPRTPKTVEFEYAHMAFLGNDTVSIYFYRKPYRDLLGLTDGEIEAMPEAEKTATARRLLGQAELMVTLSLEAASILTQTGLYQIMGLTGPEVEEIRQRSLRNLALIAAGGNGAEEATDDEPDYPHLFS